MHIRVPKIRNSTVRIFVNGQPSGSGFIISDSGLIVTCFHVVQHITPAPAGQVQVSYAPSIEVELVNGIRLQARVHASCQNGGFQQALAMDYAILQVNYPNLQPCRLGTFSSAQEGEKIYLAGYPFGIDHSIVATGMISTKWNAPAYLNHSGYREVAWLDITMNCGNSGGPVVTLGAAVNDDEVVGIATFGLNPFSGPAERFAQVAATFPGNAVLIGVNFKDFATLIGNALKSNSLGVGGCVSIQYVRAASGI